MVSNTLRDEAFASETSDGLLTLLTISHADLNPSLRFVRNPVDVISNGETYIACGFDVELPALDGSLTPSTRIRIDNVDRRIVEGVRLLTAPVSVTLQAVRIEAPDVVELDLSELRLTNVTYDMMEVSGDLGIENISQEGFPAASFDPARFPGGF